MPRRPSAAVLVTTLVVSVIGLGGSPSATVTAETTVTIAGSLQSELGCSGDWDPACSATHLAVDDDDGVWQAEFTVPAGNWEYKAALNGTWDENYGRNAQRDGTNVGLSLTAPATVKFYYDDTTHWV